MGLSRPRAWYPGLRPRLGLALGGGAARGLAHLGVLEVLEENGLAPAAVAGTSIGALFGSLWMTEGGARAAAERVAAFVASEDYRRTRVEFLKPAPDEGGWADSLGEAVRRGIVLSWTYFKESFVSEDDFRHNAEALLPECRIEDLPRPFCAVATDLRSGASVFFRRGSLLEAVLASGAVPALMPPRRIDGRLLVDGVVSEKVPVRALLSMGVDLIVGVDVSADENEIPEEGELDSGAEILARAKRITEAHLRASRLALCDLVIRPEVGSLHWLDFSGALPAVEKGREAMEAALPRLRRALARRRWWPSWRGARWMERRGVFGRPAEEA